MNKATLTSNLINSFPDAPDLDQALNTWWVNLRESGGLRLSEIGYQIFCNKLEFDSYTYNIDLAVLTPKNLILLDRYLTCPYYLTGSRKNSRLVLFGSKEAMMAALHGDMQRFIKSLTY
jgi:hypothetical protein